MKKMILAVALCLTSGAGFAEQITCNNYGKSTYCSDTRGNTATTRRYGNTTYTDYYDNDAARERRQARDSQTFNNIAHGTVPLDTATPMATLAQAISARREREQQAKQAEIAAQNQMMLERIRAEEVAKQQQLQAAENKRLQESHDLDMKIKRAQLAKLEAEDPSLYPDINNYDNVDRYMDVLLKHGIYVGKNKAALGRVSKADLLADQSLTLPDIEKYQELQAYLDAHVRYGEALGHKAYFEEKTKGGRRK